MPTLFSTFISKVTCLVAIVNLWSYQWIRTIQSFLSLLSWSGWIYRSVDKFSAVSDFLPVFVKFIMWKPGWLITFHRFIDNYDILYFIMSNVILMIINKKVLSVITSLIIVFKISECALFMILSSFKPQNRSKDGMKFPIENEGTWNNLR